MCCTTLFGFIVGVVLFRVFRRYAAWRWGYGRDVSGHCGSGSCGHARGNWRGSWRGHNAGQDFHHAAGFGAASGSGFAASTNSGAQSEAASSGRPIDELVRALELNHRQKEEAAPVVSLIKQRLGVVGPRVDAALQLIASDRFDPAPFIAQLGDLPEPLLHELVDGLEHLHTILISEQREQLKREISRR